MEVILAESHRVPAVSHMLWFKVGAADDPAGRSGLAHYVEHMMFQGTTTQGAGAYAQQVAALGGTQNAFTARDYTGYYVNIAKANLPKVMALEADRMQHLAPKREQFAKEREVIIEERRLRVDNNPQALLRERMQAALYLNHPYRIPIIGWKEEMQTLEWADVEPFWRAHYAPGNAVLTVAGDITKPELEAWANQYYGSIPNPKTTSPRRWNAEPPPLAARRVAMEHAQAGRPLWMRIYTAPSMKEGDSAQAMPLELLAQLLSGGSTGKLYQSLVVRQKLCVSVNTEYDGLALGPGSFTVAALPADGVSFERLEKAIDRELETVRTTLPFTAQEIARAKTQAKAEAVYAQDGLQGMAMLFGQLRVLGLPAELFEKWPSMIEAVTPEQMRDAAAKTLLIDRSVTGTLQPPVGVKNKAAAAPILLGGGNVH